MKYFQLNILIFGMTKFSPKKAYFRGTIKQLNRCTVFIRHKCYLIIMRYHYIVRKDIRSKGAPNESTRNALYLFFSLL